MYVFALCDDDARFCCDFEEKLAAVMGAKSIRYELVCFHDAGELLAAMEKRGFDLIFLDVVLNECNGIDVAKTIREKHYGCDIVFISSYRNFAYDSYDVRPLHYLDKSSVSEKLEGALDRFLEKNSGSVLYLTNSRGALALNLSDIVYFEVFGHELIIHRIDGTKSRRRSALKEMEDMLPPASFVRTQRSFLVNLSYVREINRHEVTMTTGEIVPIGRGMYDGVRLKFLDYIAKKNSFK